MARIRSIKPEFWEDETVGILSREARLLFIACWNAADDEGLLRWAPPYLKATAFIYDDDITVEDVAGFMEELENVGVIFSYKGGKTQQRLAYVINFHRHQVINRPTPSKLPAPSLQNPKVAAMYAARDGDACHLCHEPVQRTHKGYIGLRPSLDHIKPRAEGGGDYPSNIALAHIKCNSSKRDSWDAEGAEAEPLHEDDTETLHEPLTESVTEDSHQEGKGKEGKGREIEVLAPKPARDEVWDALAGIFGDPTTRSNRSLRGKLVKSLSAAGATALEIRARVQAWPLHFPDATLTETALEKHWDRLGRLPARASPEQVEAYQSELRGLQRLRLAQEMERGLPG